MRYDDMGYRRVGRSGLTVSEVALGSWLTYGAGVDTQTAERCVGAALDAGVIFFDTADVYNQGEAERVLGGILGGHRRADVVLATKAYFPMSDNPNDRGLSRKHLFESIHASLRRLGTEYVDLYQCHRFDANAPVAETVRAMDDLVRQGKTLYWGVSCWDEKQIAEALRIADATGAARPISNQPPYSMLDRGIEARVLPLCEREGIGQVVFSPLAEGLLTGKYRGGRVPEGSRASSDRLGQFLRPKMTEANHRTVERLAAIAERAGIELPRLALAWALRHPGVSSVICGATSPDQVRANVRAARTELPDDLRLEIEMVLSGS
jgi:voltage-dependent potassium channel beta subunit